MKKLLFWIFCLYCLVYQFSANAQQRQAPAYPLVTHDPYFSIWSLGDTINAQPTSHWTGTDQSLLGMIEVDGKVYRFLGNETKSYTEVLPTAENQEYAVKITEKQPKNGWEKVDFDDSGWKMASPPFGDNGDVATQWQSDDLWYRRSFDLDSTHFNSLFLKLHHDDNVEVFLNGAPIYEKEGWNSEFDYFAIPESVGKNLKATGNILAIHVKNTAGGRYLDAGIVNEEPMKNTVTAATQTGLDFTATQTTYSLTCGGVDVTLTFTSPLLMDDLDLMARPVSYISVETAPNDNKTHDVQVYLGASSRIASNTASQEMTATSGSTANLSFLKSGTESQPILEKKGDDIRIDWGYMYLAAPKEAKTTQSITEASGVSGIFSSENASKSVDSGKNLMLNTLFPKEKLSEAKEHLIMLAYDDVYSINYFGEQLRPWWNLNGKNTIENEMELAYSGYAEIIKKCQAFDKKLYEDGVKAGGEKYAELLEIGYRQSIAAHKLTKSPQGEILFLSKENNSNGSINTVDITYPSAPLYLVYNPDLLKGMMNGIFYYSESGKWKKPFPAHDLGTYPIATGQTYGEDMPVEEAGNMVVLSAAITKVDGNADYAKKHWESLSKWANYLSEAGLDPANQLSTDDFSGHLARNANLAVKAIVGVGGYGYMAKMAGKDEEAKKYTQMARSMGEEWTKLADAGDHYALTYDDKNTWSQKYNLVWDKLLKLNIFPKSVFKKEIDFYLTKQNEYGLPLDNRADYTKSDWILWTATLSDEDVTFKKLAHPVYKFAIETPDRVPMSDWHFTTSGKQRGFKARSVVGGYFIKLLEQEWK
ncbi:glutaminase family protein [Flavimarina sp. Hel_I_48]|uniref:glutaminase family protein n=1 Tax=Flavimarina sp. Hel_I_48 TaxID=1392488 RepID=UPI0004DF5490|nr:glutaminase family protein [Flavimarina sp. Hel_I_48]